MEQSPLIESARKEFHGQLLSGLLTTDRGIPSNADRASKISVDIANGIVSRLGSNISAARLPGQASGSRFERVCEEFLAATFPLLGHLRPGKWTIGRLGSRNRMGIASYEQYQHLEELSALASDNPLLASALGTDYLISPDIVIGREPETDEAINALNLLVGPAYPLHSSLRALNNIMPILHASISCKWTIRSDRAQNARSEALNLIRNRKGRLPHVVTVTGEPVPSRIASLALGTGDIDCVRQLFALVSAPPYHFAGPCPGTSPAIAMRGQRR